ncbi:reverse transcriptase domain-containing protein [Tanacetum coccineum]
MERGFLSQKGSGVGRSVKEKQVSLDDKSGEGSKLVDEALAHGHSRASANKGDMNVVGTVNTIANNINGVGPTPAGNGVVVSPAISTSTPGVSNSYANVTESIRVISERFANTTYGFFLGKQVSYPIVANYFSFMDGLDEMLENDPWFIRNNPLILKQWTPDVNLLIEDVGNVSVWVKLYDVLVTAFSDDGLSSIATKLGTTLMLDSYTSNMCMQSWGRSSYARAMIELQADLELKDTIVVAMPKLDGEGFYTCSGEAKNLKKPSQAPRGVPVGQKVGFKPAKQVYRPVSKKPTTNTSRNKKKDVEPAKKVINSNPFDVLNSIENDVDFGTNKRTSNLASKEVNPSGSSFWNVKTSSTSTTPIVDKIGKVEKLFIDGKVTLVDDEDKPLKKVDYSGDHDCDDEAESVDNDMSRFLASERVDFGTNSLLEQWKESYVNGDFDVDPYDDDMYEGQDIPDKIQDIYDN